MITFPRLMAIAALLALAHASPLSAQDVCFDAPLSSVEGEGLDALNAAPAAGPLASVSVLDTITVTLEGAAAARNQLVLDYGIENSGAEPVRVIAATFQDSSVTLQGEGAPRQFKLTGLAVCPTYQTFVTQNCIDRIPEAQWTLIDPGVPYSFQIATNPGHGPVESDRAAATLRLIISDGGSVHVQDVPFSRIPVGE